MSSIFLSSFITQNPRFAEDFFIKKGPEKSEPEGECLINHVQKLAL